MVRSSEVKINCKCGHEDKVLIYGTGKMKDNRIKYLEGKECRRCQILGDEGEEGVIEVHYSEYKNNEDKYVAIPNTYNRSTKTIQVVLKEVKEEEKEEDIVEKFEKEVIEPNNGEVTQEQLKAFAEANIKPNETQKQFSNRFRIDLEVKYNMDFNLEKKLIIFTKRVDKINK